MNNAEMSSLDSLQMLGQVILALILIIGLFLLIMKGLSQKKRTFLGGPARSLGGVVLGQHKSLQIIEVGQSLYVVGVGDNVQLLDKIGDEAEIALIKEMITANRGGASIPALAGLLDWISGLRGKRKSNEEMTDMSDSFEEVFRDKMNNISDRNRLIEAMLEDKAKERSKR